MLAAPRVDRFESLDVLRGVAVLGIFAVNIQAMALPVAYFANPSLNTAYFNAEGQFWWSLVSTFFQFKFITIFSALFGAGIILMVGEETPSPKLGLHYRRMLWLLLFGLVHAFLIWFGDILTAYAVAGFLVVFARRWSPQRLIIIGSLLLVLGTLLQASAQLTPEEARTDMIKSFWAPPADVIAGQIANYAGAFPARLLDTASESLLFQLVQTLMLAPRNIGVMMFGMALYKTGFFTASWSLSRYLTVGIISIAIGIAASAYATSQFFAQNFEMFSLLPAQTAQYWGSLPHAFGYAALVMAACKLSILAPLRFPFAAAGRMALTNYLLCSIIGALLYFGPPGLGRIGTVSYDEMALTTAIVWGAILIWSPLWLSQFRFGPFEWMWRSLTYARAQPLAK